VQNLNIPDNQPFSQRRGKLPWPVKGRVGHSFGSARGSHLKWRGWLLNARDASPVKAIHHGRVVFSDYLRGQGLLVIVDHGDSYLSLYAHNQVLLKETGDWVHPAPCILKSAVKVKLSTPNAGLSPALNYTNLRYTPPTPEEHSPQDTNNETTHPLFSPRRIATHITVNVTHQC